jgi:hypothetical protein
MLFIFSTAAGFEFLRLLFGGAPRDDDAPAEDETAESSGPRGATEDGRETAPSAGAPRPVPLWVAALALAICALQAPGLAARVGDHRVRQKLVGLAEMGEGAMPDTVGEYRRTRFERIDRGVGAELGEISQSWHYDGPETRSVASLDYAFFGWHEITDCYLAQGWQVDSRELTTMSDGPTIVEVTMHRPERAEFAHLAFLVCDPAGEPLPAAQSRKISMTEELSERTRMVVNSIRGVSRPEHRPTAQFQLFSQGFAPPDETRRATLRELYVRLWRDARTHLARAAEVSP